MMPNVNSSLVTTTAIALINPSSKQYLLTIIFKKPLFAIKKFLGSDTLLMSFSEFFSMSLFSELQSKKDECVGANKKQRFK
jgi:hypothetical protein